MELIKNKLYVICLKLIFILENIIPTLQGGFTLAVIMEIKKHNLKIIK